MKLKTDEPSMVSRDVRREEMKLMPTTKNEIAESILIVSSVPLLLVAGAKCLLLNAYALRVPGFSWVPHIQQSWLAWAMVYWAAFLAVCAVLLTLLRKRFGHFALIALGVSLVLWILSPVII